MRLSISDISAIQAIKDLIEINYDCHYTIQQLARRFYMNESKLRKGFYKVYQKNIYEYLIQVRVQQAKTLLQSTDCSINLIAAKVGYDIRNLEKQFRKYTGMLPLEWKKTQILLLLSEKTKTA